MCSIHCLVTCHLQIHGVKSSVFIHTPTGLLCQKFSDLRGARTWISANSIQPKMREEPARKASWDALQWEARSSAEFILQLELESVSLMSVVLLLHLAQCHVFVILKAVVWIGSYIMVIQDFHWSGDSFNVKRRKIAKKKDNWQWAVSH